MRLAWENLKLGLSSLWAHKLRTLLTLLGHIMGVITVVTLISLIQGLNKYVADTILLQGANFLYVDKFGLVFDQEKFRERAKREDLDTELYTVLRERTTTLASVGTYLATVADVRKGDQQVRNLQILGLTEDSPILVPYAVASGRGFRLADIRSRSRVAVLGSSIAKQLFEDQDPVGQKIRISQRRYTVIGTLAERGSVMGQDSDNFVAVPISELTTWTKDRGGVTVVAQPREQVSTEAAEDEIRWVLRTERGLRPSQDDDFEVYTTDALMALYKNLTQGLFMVLLGIGSIAMVVGGIVIMNIMLVSVTERTQEIGVRKALGAKKRDILFQFLTESVVVTLLGGIIGMGIGLTAAAILSLISGFPAAVTIEAIVLALVLSTLVGLTFGLFPAWRAAGLDPVEALRSE